MDIEEAQNLIEKSILSGKQIIIEYTNQNGDKGQYLIIAITSTWKKIFVTVAEPKTAGKKKRPFNMFRYDRISSVDITRKPYNNLNERLVAKIRNGSLFSETDNRIQRIGGLKGYPSSINYFSEPPISQTDAENLIKGIDIPPLEGWLRGVVINVYDGDSYELLVELDPRATSSTRLFGADALEYKEDSIDFPLGLEAKVFVEDMFKKSRFCYMKKKGKDVYKRDLVDVLNADKKNIAIELLKNGLAVPMMSYLKKGGDRDKYEMATKEAYENKKGLWSIEEVSKRYNNIVSDSTKPVNPSGYIPQKKSAIARYLEENPRAKIIRKAWDRNASCELQKKHAQGIFEKITGGVESNKYDLESYKKMCDLYKDELHNLHESKLSQEAIRDTIMHIEDMVDQMELGDGAIKGNFSKGQNSLIYHDDPESRWYKLCIPEVRFKKVEHAKHCGFKKSST